MLTYAPGLQRCCGCSVPDNGPTPRPSTIDILAWALQPQSISSTVADSPLLRSYCSSPIALIAYFLPLPSPLYRMFPGLYLTSVISFLHNNVAPLSHLHFPGELRALHYRLRSALVHKPLQMSCSKVDYCRPLSKTHTFFLSSLSRPGPDISFISRGSNEFLKETTRFAIFLDRTVSSTTLCHQQ